MVPSRLVELGRRALVAVTAGAARGEPLVKCQLLASEFYEALKRELQQTPLTDAKRATLMAAADRCDRVANAGIGPGAMVAKLGNILAMLQSDQPTPPSGRALEPVLRVIEGGRSASKSPGAIFSSSAVRLEGDAL